MQPDFFLTTWPPWGIYKALVNDLYISNNPRHSWPEYTQSTTFCVACQAHGDRRQQFGVSHPGLVCRKSGHTINTRPRKSKFALKWNVSLFKGQRKYLIYIPCLHIAHLHRYIHTDPSTVYSVCILFYPIYLTIFLKFNFFLFSLYIPTLEELLLCYLILLACHFPHTPFKPVSVGVHMKLKYAYWSAECKRDAASHPMSHAGSKKSCVTRTNKQTYWAFSLSLWHLYVSLGILR